MAQFDSEKLLSVGTPHPHGPSTLPYPDSNTPRCVGLLSQEELEPLDFLPDAEVTSLSGSVCEMPAQ